MKGLFVAFSSLVLLGRLASGQPAAPTPEVVQPTEHTYREVDGRGLKAYVFAAEGTQLPTRRPAILLFHGGGWVAGSAEWTFKGARRYASLGLVAVAVDYRLSEGKITPIDALADTCAAFRWVRQHADELHVDVSRVAGDGVSAGGQLVAAAASCGCPGEVAGGVSSKPDVLVLWSPALDVAHDGWFRKLLQGLGDPEDYAPTEHAGASTPPTCIVQGDKDTLTPLAGARQYCDRVVKAGGICELNVYPGVGHLLTRNLANQESDFDPDPVARQDGKARQERFLRERGFITAK
jgi:acetyl esterase